MIGASAAVLALSLSWTSPGPGIEYAHTATTAPDGGPIKVHVLRIDRAALAGRHVTVVLANGHTVNRQRTSAMAHHNRAIVATNGAVWGALPPVSGDPIGVVIGDGRLASEPIEGRSALLVPRDPAMAPRIATLHFLGKATVNGRERLIDGVDRLRGFIPACGGRGGDRPTEKPNGTLVCHDPSELIAYDRRFGERTRPQRSGVEVTVKDGKATGEHHGGSTPIPADGYVLSGSGDAATFLRGARDVGIDLGIDADGQRIDAADFTAALGGGPRLLRDGRTDIPRAAEGYVPPNDPGWGQRIADRNPRTMAGVDADGRLVMATVDGRQPGFSVGLSYVEGATLMRALGARDAINLDGGGSATMVIRGKVVNSPSDLEGERPVADSLEVVP